MSQGFTLWTPATVPTDEAATCLVCDAETWMMADGLPFCVEHIGTACNTCGRFVRIGMWPTCRRGPHDHGALPSFNAQRFDPVVVHFNPVTQQYRFPGAADAKMPPGFEKKELRTISDVRKLQKVVNDQERRLVDQRIGREHEHTSARESARRGELRAAMRHMSRFGRDFARIAMERNDARRPKSYDPGFHLEAFEFDRSNREPQRDVRTGWKPRS